MSDNNDSKKKLTMTALILMIFTSVYGFTNMPRSYFLMGYAAIPWFIASAILFFIPYAFMMAEYGAAFKNESGGIFSWMNASVGPRYAFVGTFMWYASYVIWMVSVSSSILIPISNALFGADRTSKLSIFGLSATQSVGIVGIILIALITFVSTKGVDKIKKVTSVGGIAVTALNVVLMVGALIVFVGSGFKLAEPMTASALFTSPNPAYLSPIAILSFLVYAIFAFGGIEVIGGLVDQTENPEKNFPKGVAIAAIIIAIGYSLGIFCIGIFTNFATTLGVEGVNKANVTYVIMSNLGFKIATIFGASEAVAVAVGSWVSRFIGISMFLTLLGAFFTLSFSPLKQLIEGSPKGLLPKKLTELKDGMPVNAMWVQAIVVMVIIFGVSFGGSAVSAFFDLLIAMTNVAMTIPYVFLSGAFIAFKKKDSIEKPFEIYKNKTITVAATVIVTAVVIFANVFSIIQPAIDGDLKTTIASVAGPVFFTVVALILYARYDKNLKKQSSDNDKVA